MRVAIITPWFPTQKNPGLGAFVVKDCLSLIDQGITVQVIHLVAPHVDDGSRKTIVSGIPTLRIPMATNNPLQIAKARTQLGQYIKHSDVVHTQAISAIEPFVFGKPGKPWVHTEHWSGISNPESLSPTLRKAQPLMKQLERLPDHVVSVSEYLAKPIRRIRRNKPVAVIPNQVPSPPQLVPRSPDSNRLRLISVGGLVQGKQPLLAVKTVAELIRRGRSTELLWLGDGPLRSQVEELADELHVPVNLPGYVSPTEVQKALGSSDMFFGPTASETFFVAAAEAIVNGRPLVVGATGGHNEYISPSIGELVADQNPNAYADAILRVEEKTRSLSSLDIAQTVGQRFSPDTVAKSYIDLYQSYTETIK